MRLRRLLGVFAASVFAMFWLLPAITHAQAHSAQTTAIIQGTLTDPSGAAVAGALITVRQVDSGEKAAETRSGDDGKFSIGVPPGRYRVTIQSASFKRVDQELTLSAGETREWNERLELEELSAHVVVTAAAEPTTLEETVAPVDILTRDDFNQRGEIWLTPVFASLPGASFSQLGPMGGTTSFFLDGGNSYYTKVLIDGVPANLPGTPLDFANFTLDDVDKVEVVHGATSALYGSDAMSGVMQIFTHRGSTRAPLLELEGDGGTFDSGNGGGQLSGLLGAFDYSAAADYFGSSGQGPDNYFRDTTLSGNFGWKFSEDDALRLTVRNNSSDAGQPGQTLLGPTFFEAGQHTVMHDFSSGLTWDDSIASNWKNHLMGFEDRLFEIEDTPAFGPPFASEFNRAGLDEQTTYLFPHGGVTGGYYFEVENGGASGRTNMAGYLEGHYAVGKRLTAMAGGREEGNQFFGTKFVPRVGAAYALHYGQGFWDDTRLRASYGKGISEPELLPADCSAQLEPEQSRTVDVGFDQVLAGNRIRLSATGFFNNFHNIVSFAFGVPNPNCPMFGGSFFNTDLGRANGAFSKIEIKATQWLSFVGQYTYDDSKVLKTANPLQDPALAAGNRLFKRPLHSANLIANAHFRRMNWNLGTYYEGRRTDSDFDSTTINGVCTGPCIHSDGSYVRVDLANSIELGHGLSTEARVQNLFNRHYSDAVGYPALRLNYMLGMKFRWGGSR